MRYIKAILSYWDRPLYLIVFVYAIRHQMEAVAITFAALMIIGGKRLRDFVLAMMVKFEQSNEFGFGGFSVKIPRDPAPLPQESLKLDRTSGISSKFFDCYNKGSFYLQQSDFEKARDMFEEAKALEPDNYQLNVLLGFVYDLLHNYKKSIEYSEKALKIKPKSFVPQFNLAVATNHLYKADKSLTEYLKAENYAREAGIGDEITIGKLNLFLGHDYRDKGNIPEALNRYRRAKEIFSQYNTQEAHFWLKDANDNIRRLEGSA